MDVSELLRSRLRTYCHVETPEALSVLREIVRSDNPPPWVGPFQDALEAAITGGGIEPSLYEKLTGDDLESTEEVLAELRRIQSALFD